MNLVEMFRKWGVSLSLLSLILMGCAGNTADVPAAKNGQADSKPTTFTNPLFSNGADPWLEYYQGNYYLTTTTWTSQLVMRKSPTLSGLATATPINIWSHTEFERCCNFWAFEFHRLKGPNGWRWYVMYTSGQDDTLDHQHLSVIESVGDDPLGPYEYKGSPMPIITTLVTARSRVGSFSDSSARALFAHHNWPIISATVKLRLNPCLPVEQKLHASAHPT